ncbi:MAG: hypothetical protein GXY77_14680 [Fibrobacter sp.]|nr:hypothetical protein [Fibrobacter sp.]
MRKKQILNGVNMVHKDVSRKRFLSVLSIISLLFLGCGALSPESPETKYTVTYDGNGNDGGVPPSPQTVDHEGGSITLDSNTFKMVRTGFIFVGWNTEVNGKGTSYTEGSPYNVNSNVTLYAEWIPKWVDNGTTLIDPDGNTYNTVVIGKQRWTVENLKTTRYADCTPIYYEFRFQWGQYSSPAFTMMDYTKPDEGTVYNYYAIADTNTKNIAPPGWRVPTDYDWTTLQDYLITNGHNWDGSSSGNKIAKSLASKTEWDTAVSFGEGKIGIDLSKNNRSGFTALPHGAIKSSGLDFPDNYRGAYWWSSTQSGSGNAYYRSLNFINEGLLRGDIFKNAGMSVRLVSDVE